MCRTGCGVMNMAAKSGGNAFRGSGYTVFRSERFVNQLLIPKIQGQPNVPEYDPVRSGPVGGAGEHGVRQLVVWPDQHLGEQRAVRAVHLAGPILKLRN